MASCFKKIQVLTLKCMYSDSKAFDIQLITNKTNSKTAVTVGRHNVQRDTG